MDEQLAAAKRAPDSAEVALLSARLRSGQISLPRAELLNYLGHGPARAIIGLTFQSRSLYAWIRGFRRWHEGPGSEAALRAILAVARVIAEDKTEPKLLRARLLRAKLKADLVAIDAWLACPCPDHLRALGRSYSYGGGEVLSGFIAQGSLNIAAHLHHKRERSIYRIAARTFDLWHIHSEVKGKQQRKIIKERLCDWILAEEPS